MASSTTFSDTSIHGDIPVINPLINFATQIPCVGAVVVPSFRTVKVGLADSRFWELCYQVGADSTAIVSHQDSHPTGVAPREPTEESVQPPNKGQKKVFNKPLLPRLIGFGVGFSVWWFL